MAGEQVSVSREINAPAAQVWAMVSDVTRMGEWSPETEGATWLGGATSAAPGVKFRGTNRNGKKKWDTVAKIVAAEPGRALAFEIAAGPLKVAEWRYAFESTATGCRVTETWTDQRGVVVKTLGKMLTGVGDRAEHNRTGMEQTLERLKSAAEAAPASA
jgi:uncharacterized protein YndB with AHSA1/START domain